MTPQYQKYQKRLIKICGERGYWMKVLGFVGDKPIWFVSIDGPIDQSEMSPSSQVPKILVVAGFHGEEKAGPWAILEWLATYEVEDATYISVIPVVNPTAFNLGKRYNTWGERSNAGFRGRDGLSEEGKILMANKDLILDCAHNGMLSLHEDITCPDYYAYTFEKSKEPGKFTCGLLDELSKHFEKPANNETIYTDAENPGPYIVNGLVYKHKDGSFEDWLFHETN